MRTALRLGGPGRALLALLAGLAACEPARGVSPVSPDSLAVVWRAPFPEQPVGRDGLATDGTRLFALVDGVSAYDLGTGTRLWRAPRPPVGPANVATSAGRVFVSSSAAVALDAASGVELWRFVPDTTAAAEIAVDDRALYIGTHSRRVYALDVATGTPLWWTEAIPAGAHPAQVGGIVAHGDTVYASVVEETSLSGHLKRGWIVAMDRTDGRVLWRYLNERAGGAHDASRHAVAGRVLLVNDLNGGAYMGIDRFTGAELWRVEGARDRLGAWDVFQVADGVAYLASNDTYLHAFDPATGASRWRAPLGASASSSAVCGEHVFAAAGSLHRVRRLDGRQTATLFMDAQGVVGDEWVRSRLLAHAGRLYFVGNRAVFAVDCR